MPRAASKTVLRGAALGASLVVISLLAGCGGGSDSPGAGAGSAQTGTGGAVTGSADVESFGETASPADRAAATRSVQGFLVAWIHGDSAKACSLMSASTKQNLAVFASKFQGCGAQLEGLRAALPAKTLARVRGIHVTGVRVQGDRGFVLYRDARGNSSAFPIVREGSAWKVGAILGSSLP